ncbi:two-component regulator propeller domain-containing protein [Chitinophaga sp. Hz27]|uniref:hybrid sensor histidine kinase/response regulator transcription factor n=1 Tax=Chitinophaga sp. Hz27 TaxID=3347169 RepID=UPI0035E31D37
MRHLLGIVLMLQSLLAFSQGEHYNFSRLNTNNGLSNNQVNAVLKDQDGYVWFATSYGLNRYDGYSCKIFRKDRNDSASLMDNNVLNLFELPNRKTWLATMSGPCIYNPDTEKFDPDVKGYLSSMGLPIQSIAAVVKGDAGRYWFLYENKGLYLYSTHDKSVKAFASQYNTPSSDRIVCIQETTDAKLWVVHWSGLLEKYDISQGKIIFSTTALQQQYTPGKPLQLFVDNDGDIWLWCYNNGLFYFQPTKNTAIHIGKNSIPVKLNSEQVSQVTQDSNGLIWVGTDHGGVTLIDKKNDFHTYYLLNNPNDPKTVSQNSVTTIYKDNRGIMWLGTYKQGISYYNSDIIQFPYYYHQESNAQSLQYDDVNRFVEDKNGNIWIGTNGGGLIYFDRKNNSFKQYLYDPHNSNSLSSNVIVSLWLDQENILWIGTYLGGLNSFDGKTFTHYRHNENDAASLADNTIWEIFEDSNKQLWIGTLGGGLDQYDRTNKQFVHHRKSGGENFISALMEDQKGNLWVGTSGGITVFNKNKTVHSFYHQLNQKNSLSDNIILCLLEDSKGGVWIGTREGLNLFDSSTGTFQTFTIADGLPDNVILNILEDAQQNFWISTPNGLCKATPMLHKGHMSFSVVNYDATNNLQNKEFNENAALKTRSGELIFGGPFGFNIIMPAAIKQPVGRHDIAFTGFQILDRNITPGESINNRVLLDRALSQVESIDLKYKENVFSIDFASLDFSHNSNDKYAYMLEGFNTDWLYTEGSQRRATYTNLSPGHYVFKVKVLDRTGVWSETKTIKINIEPPFWRTPFAYIIYLLTAIGLFWLIRRITLERIHMRFEVRQQRREVERAHALEQMKTKFFTNVSHELRTPLSLIIAPLNRIITNTTDHSQKEQLHLVQRNAKRLLNLVNQLLDFRKMEVQEVKLHPAVGDIVSFCRDASLSFTDIASNKKIQLSFSSNIDFLEIYFDKDKIEKILFNLLSNAFKYTNDNGKVSVELKYTAPSKNEEDGTLAIHVKDSGIGIPATQHEKIFERFFQTEVPGHMVNQGTGIGLAITKEFVKLHNGSVAVQSEPGQGTCFEVSLPARKIYVTPHIPAVVPPVDEETQLSAEESRRGDRKKTIMVVEDNEDLRFYLKDNLKDQYHVEEATNGMEGWEKIKRLNPDLVVSDIMMPLMDGVALAGKIKSETLTAHIPVILLTAMGSEEKQLEGLKAGANDYVTKPFTFEILSSRINNLLMQQQLLKKRFQKQIEVHPEEVTITPVDEKFLKQALDIIEKHIDNPDFSVDEFSKEMFMSRVTLYRKINALTGKSPLDFIRSIRLKRAAQLLEKSGLSVAEVAYQVGFNTPKVFSKLFKEEFSVTPSEYAVNPKSRSAKA